MASLSTPDLCVIGAGASGLAVAKAARRLGANVVIVEKAEPGGPNVPSGALALRALAAAAERAVLPARGQAFGVFAQAPEIGFRKLHDHIAQVVAETRRDGGAAQIEALGIELVRGIGSFFDARTLIAGDTEIRARRFVIATGAQPVLPEIPGLHAVPYFTTETIFDNSRRLGHLVVIGAGPLGLELALAYRRLGAEVTVLEAGKVLAHADPELAEIALRRLREEGVTLREDAAVVALQPQTQGVHVMLRGAGEPQTIEATHILVAPERAPRLDELALDAGKIRRTKSNPGTLALNAALRTSNARVYAVGAAAGHAHPAAAIEAGLVVRAALLGEAARYEPAAMPRLTLTDPEIAEIGLNEPMARARFKTAFSVLRATYAENDRARAGRDGMGLVKLIVGRTGKILGAGIVGAGAGELAALFGLAIAEQMEASRLAQLATPYPSHADLARALGEQAAAARPPSPWQRRLFALNRLLP